MRSLGNRSPGATCRCLCCALCGSPALAGFPAYELNSELRGCREAGTAATFVAELLIRIRDGCQIGCGSRVPSQSCARLAKPCGGQGPFQRPRVGLQGDGETHWLVISEGTIGLLDLGQAAGMRSTRTALATSLWPRDSSQRAGPENSLKPSSCHAGGDTFGKMRPCWNVLGSCSSVRLSL